jgi:uncharacterized protein (TIRG00374 family)
LVKTALRRRIAVGAGLLVSALFMWLALRGTDFAAIGASLGRANVALAAPFLLSLFAFYWLKSVRWKDLLSPERALRSAELFPVVMIGYAGTAILPMQMGELVRAYIAGKRFDLRYSLVLGSIGMERIFDLLTILALLGFVLATTQSTPPALIKAGYVIAAVSLFGLAMAYLLVAHTDAFLTTMNRLMSPLPDGVSSAILDQLSAASRGLATVTRPALFARVALNSLLQWALMGLCIWCSLIALDVQVPVSGVILVLVTTIVGISLPTSPGYVGNIQFAFVIALRPFGISAESAIAASVFYHLLAYLAVVVVGFACVHKLGYRMFEIQAQAQSPTGKN